jgi:hypothetical protein
MPRPAKVPIINLDKALEAGVVWNDQIVTTKPISCGGRKDKLTVHGKVIIFPDQDTKVYIRENETGHLYKSARAFVEFAHERSNEAKRKADPPYLTSESKYPATQYVFFHQADGTPESWGTLRAQTLAALRPKVVKDASFT